MDFINKLLDWIKQVLPSVTAVGSFIYNYMLRRVKKAEQRADNERYKKEMVENELEVHKKFDGMSDSDVIDSVIGKDSK